MKNIIFVVITLLACNMTATAQSSREKIKNSIASWGSCRLVAITNNNGNVAIYSHNGHSAAGVPVGLADALRSVTNSGHRISDVVLTEGGKWLVLYGNNGFISSGAPADMDNRLRQYSSQAETVLSVTFRDNGEWVIVTRNQWIASNNTIANWIKDVTPNSGGLLSVYLSENAMSAVYDNTTKVSGNVPQGLSNALRASNFKIQTVKMAGSSCFIADANGNYSYSM